MAAGDKISVDQFMERRKAHVGTSSTGNEVVFKAKVTPIAKEPEIEIDDGQKIKSPGTFNKTERSQRFIMSSEGVDRDGDIIRQEGIDRKNFDKNPVGLMMHRNGIWPVGAWSDIQSRKRPSPAWTEGTLTFLPAGGPVPEVDQAAWMVENGGVKTVSIGFMPIEIEEIDHSKNPDTIWSWGLDVKRCELYECSIVPIPAQPLALAKGIMEKGEMGLAKSLIMQALDEWAVDPRTAMLIPRKQLEGLYQKHFGDRAFSILSLDSLQTDHKKTALYGLNELIKESEHVGLSLTSDDGTEHDSADPTEEEIKAFSRPEESELSKAITINVKQVKPEEKAPAKPPAEKGKGVLKFLDDIRNKLAGGSAQADEDEVDEAKTRAKAAMARLRSTKLTG